MFAFRVKLELCALLLGLAACAADAAPAGAPLAAPLTTTDDSPAPIAWGECPEDFAGECARLQLPLDHAQPSGPTIQVFVSRYRARSEAARAQLWLLGGGPGGSAYIFKDSIEQVLAPLLPDVDFYVLEHRGLGESTRLGCPEQEAPDSRAGTFIDADERPACIAAIKAKWGDGLAHLSTTEDAHDLASLIARTREPDKKVLLYGYSYGTTRALRLLQIQPDLVDGVVLDSVVAPGVQFESQLDDQYDPVGQSLAALCAADGVCRSKLGADAWGKLGQLWAQLDAGACPAFQERSTLRQLVPKLLESQAARGQLFALVYRLQRCAPADVSAVEHYVRVMGKQLNAINPVQKILRDSDALGLHIGLSELWPEPPPNALVLGLLCATRTVCTGLSALFASLYDQWPRYPRDGYTQRWPTTRTPLLALNGTLDPVTPIEKARTTQLRLTAPDQSFVSVPFSPHGVLFQSPVQTVGAPSCGAQLLASFVEDPAARPDTRCLDDLTPVTFSLPAARAQELLGTSDLWEN